MKHEKQAFDWAIYANATFAGLAVLVPIPLIDFLLESYFKRQMLPTIAKRRKVLIPAEALQVMLAWGCAWQGCLLWPLVVIFWFLKRLSTKILYFLTIKEATDKLSYYWHQAYLMEYLVGQGHLNTAESASWARPALEKTLEETVTSPLHKTALDVIENSRHILRTLFRLRRRQEEDEVVQESRNLLEKQWEEVQEYLEELAERYQAQYEQIKAQALIKPLPTEKEQA